MSKLISVALISSTCDGDEQVPNVQTYEIWLVCTFCCRCLVERSSTCGQCQKPFHVVSPAPKLQLISSFSTRTVFRMKRVDNCRAMDGRTRSKINDNVCFFITLKQLNAKENTKNEEEKKTINNNKQFHRVRCSIVQQTLARAHTQTYTWTRVCAFRRIEVHVVR